MRAQLDPAPTHLRISGCRSCGETGLATVLSLGSTPLANSLVAPGGLGRTDPTFPLTLVFCPTCTLVQILETIPPDHLFREYLYFSSFSSTMLEHARGLASRLVRERRLDRDSLVVEVASNDGYLLQNVLEAGVGVLGIEPALNIAEVARERGVPTISEFFDAGLATRLQAEGRRADVLIGINVLGHVADLASFVAGMRVLLAPDGVGIVEVPYLRDLIEANEFDTVYHEHLHYFSVASLDWLLASHGLRLLDVERLPIHGGSLRAWFARSGPEERPGVERLLAEEEAWGIRDPALYEAFGRRVENLREELWALVSRLRSEGRSIAAYGAAAKGNTLLSYCGIGAEQLDFVVDRSPHKQGLYMPGNHLPIRSPQSLLSERPDYVLMLTWNFTDEIVAQQAEYLAAGGRFIVPIPRPRILPE